ncbi:hypothetical protein CALCODRAFT_506735 [Calocera cornea HHB12733]|uniref:Uncharacterized protein n=1 Tax=Calocera cornea HHB12733 TaxID=1353952 RepID=A0A165IJG1_9BASI|nr:hypothetical protein CALCODRAFT_506735 [Calocera cornea HHB12733]
MRLALPLQLLLVALAASAPVLGRAVPPQPDACGYLQRRMIAARKAITWRTRATVIDAIEPEPEPDWNCARGDQRVVNHRAGLGSGLEGRSSVICLAGEWGDDRWVYKSEVQPELPAGVAHAARLSWPVRSDALASIVLYSTDCWLLQSGLKQREGAIQQLELQEGDTRGARCHPRAAAGFGAFPIGTVHGERITGTAGKAGATRGAMPSCDWTGRARSAGGILPAQHFRCVTPLHAEAGTPKGATPADTHPPSSRVQAHRHPTQS